MGFAESDDSHGFGLGECTTFIPETFITNCTLKYPFPLTSKNLDEVYGDTVKITSS